VPTRSPRAPAETETETEIEIEAEIVSIARALSAGAAGRPEAAGRLARLRERYRSEPGRFDPDSLDRLRAMAEALRAAGPPPPAGRRDATLDDARAMLRDVFGHPAFRPGQESIVEAVLSGRDCVGVMPTGAGKSLTYQLPSRLLGGTTLVVSPLIALMKDQVDAMARAGLRATFLNSTLEADERRQRVASLRRGEVELLYAAPEGLEASVGGALAGLGLSLIAVDEAHCISHWGHDFRPAYRNLAGLRGRYGAPVLALTATATPAVTRDIASQLGMVDPLVVTGSFLRRNLKLHAVKKGGDGPTAKEAILRLVRARRGQSGIVYAITRKSVEATAENLQRHGVRAAAYHAGLEPEERSRVQEAFQAGAVEVVVATVAFGMGIDKPDIRFVLHQDLPRSLEAYSQEVGRAGRDGADSDCVLLYSWADVQAWDRMAPDDADLAAAQRRQVRTMFRFADEGGCRHQRLVGYFGERVDGCGDACDACSGRDPLVGLPRAGRGRAGADRARRERRAGGGTPRRRSAGDEPQVWPDEIYGEETPPPRRGLHPDPDPDHAPASDPRAVAALLDALKTWRTSQARARGVPAFVIFPDATLAEVALRRPRTKDDLADVKGIGPKKLADFGADLLRLVGAP
jgi:ATP-dependent DNA helicase RecQ